MRTPTLALLGACLLLSPLVSRAGEGGVGVAVGVMGLAGYTDLQLLYHPEPAGRLYLGLRYLSGTDVFSDPFTGRDLTDDSMRLFGPSLYYRLGEGPRGFWAGAALYSWHMEVSSRITGEVDRADTLAPFVGAGYMGWEAERLFWSVGFLFSLGGPQRVTTSVSDDEGDGLDPQLMIGLRF